MKTFLQIMDGPLPMTDAAKTAARICGPEWNVSYDDTDVQQLSDDMDRILKYARRMGLREWRMSDAEHRLSLTRKRALPAIQTLKAHGLLTCRQKGNTKIWSAV